MMYIWDSDGQKKDGDVEAGKIMGETRDEWSRKSRATQTNSLPTRENGAHRLSCVAFLEWPLAVADSI